MDFKDYTINELRHLLADNDIDFARTDDKADLIRLAENAFGSNKIKNTAYIEKATARLKKEGKYVESSVSNAASKVGSSTSSTSYSNNRSGSGLPKWLLPVAGVAVAGLAAWALFAKTDIFGGTAGVLKDASGKILGLGANVSGSLKNLLGEAGAGIAGIASNATDIDGAKANAQSLLDAVDILPDNIKNADGVKNTITKLKDAVTAGDLDGINAAIAGLQGSVADAAKEAKDSATKAIADINVDAKTIDDAKKNADEAVKQFDLLPDGIKNNAAVADAKAQLDEAINSGDFKRINESLKDFQAAVKDATDEGQQAISLIAGIPASAASVEEAKSNGDFALDQFGKLPDAVKKDSEVEKTQKALSEALKSDKQEDIQKAIDAFQVAVANAAANANNSGQKTEGTISQDGRKDGVYFGAQPFQGKDGEVSNTNAINYAGQHVTINDHAKGYQGHTYVNVTTDSGVTFWIDQAAIK